MNQNDFGFGPPPQYPGQANPPSNPAIQNTQTNMEVANTSSQPRTSSQDVNPHTLCRMGQETVQDIISRTQEIFNALKQLQPPNGTVTGAAQTTERKARVRNQLRNVSLLMKSLKMVYDKCCDLTKDMDMSYTHVESLIPLKDEWDGKSEERKQTEAFKLALAERATLREQSELLNQQIKEAVDLQRRTVWEINVMLAMRKS